MERKPNFSPPAWLVTRFDVTLVSDVAERFDALRRQRTAPLPADDHTRHEHLHPNELFNRAITLLLEKEGL